MTRFPVAALVLPQVAHATAAHCQPAAAGDVFRQLGPSTVIWLPGAEAENYRFNAAMTRRLPGFRLALATEPAANVAAEAVCGENKIYCQKLKGITEKGRSVWSKFFVTKISLTIFQLCRLGCPDPPDTMTAQHSWAKQLFS